MLILSCLEFFLIIYRNVIEREHIKLFEDMLQELKIYQTGKYFEKKLYGIHKSDCFWNTYDNVRNTNTCACVFSYTRYRETLKLYNMYAIMLGTSRMKTTIEV